MPKCKECNRPYKARVWIDGVLKVLSGGRKKCLDCQPFCLDRKKNKIGLPVTCSVCSKIYYYNRNKGHRLGKCNSCCCNAKRAERQQAALEYKGGKCIVCGYNRCSRAMDFHHIDPQTKKFNISSGHCRSWEVVKQELDKCVLLCANCHREFDAGMIQLAL